MSTDRPDLPMFEGLNVREHAATASASIRAINHITGWPHGMTRPSDAYSVVSNLSSVAARVPQACEQIDRQLANWLAAGQVGIDYGRPFADNPGQAIAVTGSALRAAADRARELFAALDLAVQTLAYAHRTGPRLDELVDDVDNEVNG